MGQAGYDEYLLQAIIDINSADSVDFGPAATCDREIGQFWSADPLRLHRSGSRVFVFYRVIGPPCGGLPCCPTGHRTRLPFCPDSCRIHGTYRDLSQNFNSRPVPKHPN